MSLKQSIPLKSVANARELGGYRTPDGRTVKTGVLLRTGNLNNITDEDIQTLKDQYRLSDIIDFRMEMEMSGYEDPVIGGVANTHLDVIGDLEYDQQQIPDVDINKLDVIQLVEMSEQMGMLDDKMYIGFLSTDSGKEAYSQFFRILLAADPDRAVLWHCTSGKDRTGLAAMLLLSLLGVEESVIMEDYMLTNEYNTPRIEGTKKYLKSRGCDDALTEKAALVFDAVDRRFMENAIAFLKEKYGSVLGYIRSELNISDGDIGFLKEKYTD
jgi:protein-tyrosine phosphatase